ncbi:thioredoxin family protein [Nitrosospira briensis]|uniref:thioredoxin family protein n=1 Tax=Nitrosospira briensis TaxID=35799 RepID=UPI000AC214BF
MTEHHPARQTACAPEADYNLGMNNAYAAIEPPRAEIDSLEAPVLMEFGTPWCRYCRAAQPLIASAFSNHPSIRHIKIEDGKGRPLGRSFRVKFWPTLIFLHHGKEIARLVRPVDSVAISKALDELAACRT